MSWKALLLLLLSLLSHASSVRTHRCLIKGSAKLRCSHTWSMCRQLQRLCLQCMAAAHERTADSIPTVNDDDNVMDFWLLLHPTFWRGLNPYVSANPTSSLRKKCSCLSLFWAPDKQSAMRLQRMCSNVTMQTCKKHWQMWWSSKDTLTWW